MHIHSILEQLRLPLRTDEDWRDYFYLESDDVYHVSLQEPSALIRRKLPEALVQDIWQNQNFDRNDLQTVTGQEIQIVRPGRRNTDEGPDFSGAVLRIDGVDWIGDVEIHVASGQWNDHRHTEDRLYNSVILHVTLHSDVWTGSLKREDGTIIPELVLYPRLLGPIRHLVHDFHRRIDEPILCAAQWDQVPEALVRSWFDELSRKRLSKRARHVRVDSEFGFDADQYLYERIFAALGYAKNSDPMRDLARRLSLRFVVNELADDDLEACFLGVAGLIPQPQHLLDADRETADYAMALRERFERLRHIHNLDEWPRERWRFFRLRPNNFPPLRIAQGLTLLKRDGLIRNRPLNRLRAAAISTQPLRNLRKAFYIRLPDFWKRHVRLEKPTSMVNTELGMQRIDVILVNAVLPVLARMATNLNDLQLQQAVQNVMDDLPPEFDEVVRRFKSLGTKPRAARDAQAMHELYSSYCLHARCLSCKIGQFLLSKHGAP